MPQLLEHIDAIAPQKQCDVLFLRFEDWFTIGSHLQADRKSSSG